MSINSVLDACGSPWMDNAYKLLQKCRPDNLKQEQFKLCIDAQSEVFLGLRNKLEARVGEHNIKDPHVINYFTNQLQDQISEQFGIHVFKRMTADEDTRHFSRNHQELVAAIEKCAEESAPNLFASTP